VFVRAYVHFEWFAGQCVAAGGSMLQCDRKQEPANCRVVFATETGFQGALSHKQKLSTNHDYKSLSYHMCVCVCVCACMCVCILLTRSRVYTLSFKKAHISDYLWSRPGARVHKSICNNENLDIQIHEYTKINICILIH